MYFILAVSKRNFLIEMICKAKLNDARAIAKVYFDKHFVATVIKVKVTDFLADNFAYVFYLFVSKNELAKFKAC